MLKANPAIGEAATETKDAGNREPLNNDLLAVYEQAQAVALHTDTVIHEVTAIIWGANTLLLGFILEVPCTSENQGLVILVAALGIAMTIYAPKHMERAKEGQDIAYGICREIEAKLDVPVSCQLHIQIKDKYSKLKPGQRAVKLLTVLFVIVWACVFVYASRCYLCSPKTLNIGMHL